MQRSSVAWVSSVSLFLCLAAGSFVVGFATEGRANRDPASLAPAQAAAPATADAFVVSRIESPVLAQLPVSDQAAIRAYLSGRVYDRSHMPELSERIREAMQEAGYFKAIVHAPVVEPLDNTVRPARVLLKFSGESGRQYRLGELKFAGVTRIPPAQARASFPLQPGDVLDVSKIRTGLSNLKQLYNAINYLNMVATPDVDVDNGSATVTITIAVNEDKRFILPPGLDKSGPNQRPLDCAVETRDGEEVAVCRQGR